MADEETVRLHVTVTASSPRLVSQVVAELREAGIEVQEPSEGPMERRSQGWEAIEYGLIVVGIEKTVELIFARAKERWGDAVTFIEEQRQIHRDEGD